MRTSERLNMLRKSPGLLYALLLRGRYNFKYDLMPVHIDRMPLSKRTNLIRSGVNLLHRRLEPWSWPTHMHIELTNYCNLKCHVCPTGTGRLLRPPLSMDPLLLKSLLDEVGGYLLTASLWGWGEPLLHPRLEEVLKIIHNRGIVTFLSTNGQNLNDEKVLDALVKYPPTFLIVALDGITDETNAKFRVGARVAPALEGVRRLSQMKKEAGSDLPRLHLRYIVMKHNEHELERLPSFAVEHDFDILTIRTLSIIDGPENVHFGLVPDNEKYRAYNYENNRRVSRQDFYDEKAFTFPAVFADGTVVACDQDFSAQHPYGRLTRGTSFADIWWGQRASEIRRTIRDEYRHFTFCLNCPFRDRSTGSCSVEYVDLKQNGYKDIPAKS